MNPKVYFVEHKTTKDKGFLAYSGKQRLLARCRMRFFESQTRRHRPTSGYSQYGDVQASHTAA
jgi:hypothetical protein